MEGTNLPQSQPDPENETELQGLLQEVQHILSFSERREAEIIKLFGADSLLSASDEGFRSDMHPAFYTEQQVKDLAVSNRLRFLPVSLFNGAIPYKAISIIKAYQHRHPGVELEFFMLAPAKSFTLRDHNRDPFLFCKTTNGFQLLCRWGKSFPFYHQLIHYPLRSFNSLIICCLLAGLLTVICASFFGIANSPHLLKSLLFKIPVLILSSGFIATLAICFGLLNYMEFSEDNWMQEDK
jgi:hypothetical protein